MNTIIPFPGRLRPVTESPELFEPLDINALVTDGRNGFTAYPRDDGTIEIRDENDKIAWSIVPGEVIEYKEAT